MKKLQEKILLEEPEGDAVVLMDPDKLPDVELTKPLEVEEPQVSEEDKTNGYINMLSTEISDTYNDISNLKSVLVSLGQDLPDREDLKEIINSIIDERTIHVGMLQKAIDLLSESHKELLDAGEEKAEAIASEPAQDLNKE